MSYNFPGLTNLQRSYNPTVKEKKLIPCTLCGALMKNRKRAYCKPCSYDRSLELKRKYKELNSN